MFQRKWETICLSKICCRLSSWYLVRNIFLEVTTLSIQFHLSTTFFSNLEYCFCFTVISADASLLLGG